MTNPDQILNAIERALRQADRVPDTLDYLTHEWTTGTEPDMDVTVPFCEIQVPGDQRGGLGVRRTNEPVAEIPIRDENDGIVGEVNYIPYEMDVQIEVGVAAGSDADGGNIGQTITTSLYEYDGSVVDIPVPLRGEPTTEFPDGVPLDTVRSVRVDGGGTHTNTSTTPSLRRWLRTIEIGYYEALDTVEEFGPVNYVEEIVWAHDGQMVSDGETVSYDPNLHYP